MQSENIYSFWRVLWCTRLTMVHHTPVRKKGGCTVECRTILLPILLHPQLTLPPPPLPSYLLPMPRYPASRRHPRRWPAQPRQPPLPPQRPPLPLCPCFSCRSRSRHRRRCSRSRTRMRKPAWCLAVAIDEAPNPNASIGTTTASVVLQQAIDAALRSLVPCLVAEL